jgi:MYXO-CTERM domain-containing protein
MSIITAAVVALLVAGFAALRRRRPAPRLAIG